jgi:hypothetical protein
MEPSEEGGNGGINRAADQKMEFTTSKEVSVSVTFEQSQYKSL